MLETVNLFITWWVTSGFQFVGALTAVLSALIALFLLIPGEQPEKTLQAVVDFLSKFSAK